MPADPAALRRLAERLEAATEGSLELDGMLWCFATGYVFEGWDGAGCRYRASPSSHLSHVRASIVRPYSASIDDAMALCEGQFGPHSAACMLAEVASDLVTGRHLNAGAIGQIALALVRAAVAEKLATCTEVADG